MRNKHELYAPEQHEMIQRIIDVLQLDSDFSITLHDLDQDVRKQTRLMNLVPEIRKWFASSRVEGVSEPGRMKRPWLSLIKRIVEKEYDISKEDVRLYRLDPVVRTKKYTFKKKI